MEKFLEYIQEASKITRIIDHMLYVTYPLVKDTKILVKILTEAKKATAYCINAILQYEYLYKRIKLYSDAKTNLRTFIEKCAPKYSINQSEIKQVLELFELAEAHKKSPFEFAKGNKVVILSENMKQNTITLEKTKEFLILTKNILQKTQKTIISQK